MPSFPYFLAQRWPPLASVDIEMKFRYLTDPLFLFCLFLYPLNRFYLKPHFTWSFLHNYLNDVICFPFCLPIMLWIQKQLHLRNSDSAPSAMEIIIPLIIWSWIFEIWLPQRPYWNKLCTSDPVDIICYSIGSLAAILFWHAWYRESSKFGDNNFDSAF